jgi:predicted PurR-regulated permease PerM
MENDDPTQQPYSRTVSEVRFFFFVLACAFAAFAYVMSSFVTDLVLGFLIASACRPWHLRFERRLQGRSMLSATLVTTWVAVLISVPLVYLVTALSQEVGSAYDAVHNSLNLQAVHDLIESDDWFGRTARRVAHAAGIDYSAEGLRQRLAHGAGAIAAFLTPQLNALVSNILSILYHFALMLVVVFFGLLDGASIKRRLFDLSPLPNEEEERIVQKFKDVWSAVLVGNGIGSAIQGVLGGIAMWACGLPSPLLWGVIMTLLAFLPLIGITGVVVPATLYLMIEKRFIAAFVFFAFCTVMGFVVEHFVKTKLMGDRMKMHSLLIFLAVLGGISAFGVGGLLYGPLIATFFLTVLDLYERLYRPRLFPTAAERLSRASSVPLMPPLARRE